MIKEQENMPFFSIGIPVYNAAQHLINTIKSIQMQNYINFEVICIDDGSTDDSFQILQHLRKVDARIKVFQNEVNKGIAFTRKRISNKARGKYFLWVDADDEMLPSCLQNLYSFYCDAKNENVILIQNADIYYNNKNHILYSFQDGYRDTYDIRLKMMLSNGIKSYPWTIVGKTSFFSSVRYPDNPQKYVDDQLISYRYLDNAESVYFMNKIHYRHILYDMSDSHSPLFYKRLFETYLLLSKEDNDLNEIVSASLEQMAYLNIGLYYAKTFKKTKDVANRINFCNMIKERRHSTRLRANLLGRKEKIQYYWMIFFPSLFFEYYSRREML